MKASGRRPRGFRAPSYSFSRNTLGLLLDEGIEYDSSLKGDDLPYLLTDGARTAVELPTDLSLDDWTQYVCLKDFGYMLPIASPQRAIEVFRAEFDAAHKYGGVWIAVWHPFVSGRMSRVDAIEGLIGHMQAAGGVWFAPLEDIAAHVRRVIASGAWTPRVDKLPYSQYVVLSRSPARRGAVGTRLAPSERAQESLLSDPEGGGRRLARVGRVARARPWRCRCVRSRAAPETRRRAGLDASGRPC